MNTVNRLYRRRIGEILVSQGVVSSDQLDEALAIQKKTGELLGVILLDLGLVTESDIAKTICIQYQIPFLSLNNYEFDGTLASLFPPEFLIANKLLPFDRIGNTLLIMITEIPPEDVLAEIPKLTRLDAALYIGYPSEVETHLNTLFASEKAEALAQAAARRTSVAKAHTSIQKAAVPQAQDTSLEDALATVEENFTTIPGHAENPDDDDVSMAPSITIEAAGGGEGEGGEPAPLVFGDSAKNFLEELDSTWDSIFPGSEEEDS